MSNALRSLVVRRWSRHPRCVGLARGELSAALESWGLQALWDPAALVLSELLTNAGRHARASPGREIETRFQPVGGGLRIEVHDGSEVAPQECKPDEDACEGRGLLLVSALADEWGFGERGGPGKVVWAEIGLNRRTDGGDGGGA
ncbi:ATP-binding protein [Streptomyces sp. BE230]|uniref:ATP-binding protein n=1 Tax=Streptomyces sp. BE230 TaxID=3002526 RepID=UPI002ED22F07|nr:ATP-binding protein [Streptomyces sp. BE230]